MYTVYVIYTYIYFRVMSEKKNNISTKLALIFLT